MGKVLIPGLRLVSHWLTVTKEQLIIPCAVSFIEFVDLKNIRRLLLGFKLNLHAEMFLSFQSACIQLDCAAGVSKTIREENETASRYEK